MSERNGYHIVDQYGVYFVTFTIVGWVDVFSRKECKQIIIDALRYCADNKGLVVHAYVIMESHLHLILSASDDSQGLSAIIRDFKKHTSKEILQWVRYSGRESRREWMLIVFKYHAKYNKRNAEYQVWQQDNQPKELFYPNFTMQKIGYIHRNPVMAGIVDDEDAYLHSSARNYAGRTDYLIDVQILDFGVQEGFIAM
jgi:REP element-mobilizing transposase RayT